MADLVKIHKQGEKHKLTILRDHLEEHKKLGWHECAPDDDSDQGDFDPETASVKQMREFLKECGIEFDAKAKADELRELCRNELSEE
jgi:hypothetical protein